MVPTLKVPKDKLKENGFINGYILDEDKKDVHYENSVYLLFQPKNLDKFREFLDSEYERTKNVIEDYDYDKGYVVVVYKLDDSLIDDFTLIKEGKYSKTSDDFKKLFPKTIEIVTKGRTKNEASLQYRIFNKTEDLVTFWENKLGVDLKKITNDNFEVWEGYDLLRETLNIKKIKEYV